MPDDLLDFGYAEAFVESHYEDSLCCGFPENLRNDDELALAEKIGKPLYIFGLVLEIHLFCNDSRKLFDDCAGSPYGVVIDELLDDEQEVLNDAYVRRDEILYAGPENFDDDLFA